MSESPAVFLDVYFNSKGKHSRYALELPQVDAEVGFSVPWPEPHFAYRSWRSEWGVVDLHPKIEQTALWQPGLRVLELEASDDFPGYSPVSGRLLSIRFFDLGADSLAPEAADESTVTYWIEFATIYCPKPGDSETVDPNTVLPSYVGLDGVERDMPPGKNYPNGSICSEIKQEGKPAGVRVFPGSRFHQSPEVANTVHVRFADFKDTPYTAGAVRIFVAIFARVTSKTGSTYFYDDPEMDVNVP